ncbi:pentapeptide repeat-containing protein [Streptomyces sp. NPDC002671]
MQVRIGSGAFDRAEFSGRAVFRDVQFSGPAGFDRARFARSAWFDGAEFSSSAAFRGAMFSGTAGFEGARFSSWAGFGKAQFSSWAAFEGTQFTGVAGFEDAEFAGDAEFGGTRFAGDAGFEGAQFSGAAKFGGAQFSGKAGFATARFATASLFGPLVCKSVVELWGAVFEAPVTLEIAARDVWCVRTEWKSTARVRLRYATVDLGQAVLSAPVAITAHPRPFATPSVNAVDEGLLAGFHERVHVASVQGVDAAHLVLTDTDLTECLFSGAFHLDQIRLEGRTTFASVPTSRYWHGIPLTWWTRRRTLAEEHHWRAQRAGHPAPPPGHALPSHRWRPGRHHPDPVLTPDPEDVAALYRQLRKAFEDGKNEPGAADFYYGECEMRRREDSNSTPKSERWLLWWYWLLSGYGLRALRAIGWLAAAMSLTVLLLMGFGLPTHDPDPATTGTVHGTRISLSTSTPDPALHGRWSQRMTPARAEKAFRVAVNSVIFRSSGQNLTTLGTYIEMVSRLLEPTLLALAVLAVRGRIKR